MRGPAASDANRETWGRKSSSGEKSDVLWGPGVPCWALDGSPVGLLWFFSHVHFLESSSFLQTSSGNLPKSPQGGSERNRTQTQHRWPKASKTCPSWATQGARWKCQVSALSDLIRMHEQGEETPEQLARSAQELLMCWAEEASCLCNLADAHQPRVSDPEEHSLLRTRAC